MANDRYREIFRTNLVGYAGNEALTSMEVIVGLLVGSIAVVVKTSYRAQAVLI